MAEIWKPQTIDVYKSWADAINDEASDLLSQWESSFMANITMRLEQGVVLTQPQAEKLEQLYAHYTK